MNSKVIFNRELRVYFKNEFKKGDAKANIEIIKCPRMNMMFLTAGNSMIGLRRE